MTLQTRHFYAMGSHMTVWLESTADVLDGAVARFASAEKTLSRFLPDSELTQLNARSGRWVSVSAEMWPILTRALQLAAATNGRFDPTILPALENAGYAHAFAAGSAGSQPTHAPSAPIDYRAVALDADRRAVRLPPGMRLDLGGIAKGMTAQAVVAWLSQWGACLLDAGGDLVAGAAPAQQPGWPVGIAAPASGDAEPENVLRLWLADATLATSGVDYRQWQRDGAVKHHIIDPQSGDSAETDLLTVSVLADDAGSAEAWATAALVAGRDRALHLFSQRHIKAALIDRDRVVTLTPALQPLVQWEC